MISHLLATIMMALGVASGIKTTSNTFYDAEKPQPKKAVISNNYTCYWSIATNFDDTTDKYWSYKQYLRDSQSTSTQNQGVNVLFDPYLITNTAYTISEKGSANNRTTENWIILKFTNYTNAVQQINITATITYEYSRTVANTYAIYESEDTTFNEMIDLTLNRGTKNVINNVFNNATKTLIATNTSSQAMQQLDTIVSTQTPQITLDAAKTKYVMIYNYYGTGTDENDNYGWLVNNTLTLEGTYVQQNITQEIVDIPNLMYTVLSMPFSFISTAFNLTVFPNTPYALNFGNLFLTILAVFILMWLIRKVFH